MWANQSESSIAASCFGPHHAALSRSTVYVKPRQLGRAKSVQLKHVCWWRGTLTVESLFNALETSVNKKKKPKKTCLVMQPKSISPDRLIGQGPERYRQEFKEVNFSTYVRIDPDDLDFLLFWWKWNPPLQRREQTLHIQKWWDPQGSDEWRLGAFWYQARYSEPTSAYNC